MVDNLGRKITLIFSLLAISIISLVVSGGFRLGLDLEGGTRLVYSVDFEQAAKDGLILESELQDKDQLFNEMRDIWQERFTSVASVPIRREGENRIVIELPGQTARANQNVKAALGADITADAISLSLEADEATLEQFGTSGGEIQMGTERIRYSKRVGKTLGAWLLGIFGFLFLFLLSVA